MIRLNDITVKFNNAYILKDFNLTIEKGEKVLISGKSGIGKSTLLKLLLGFTLPDKGSILFKDATLDKDNIWEFRKNVAYVSQDLDIGEGEVKELIKNIFIFKSNSEAAFNKDRLTELMHIFEFDEEILSKNYEELSGGEKQRVVIIISLLLQRDIFLLDEISSALDENLKKKVIDYFLEQKDLTVIIVSHDTNHIQKNQLRTINLENQS
ncbi:ATP-binding cassette domain-containing protein [Bacteroidota bacterium]